MSWLVTMRTNHIRLPCCANAKQYCFLARCVEWQCCAPAHQHNSTYCVFTRLPVSARGVVAHCALVSLAAATATCRLLRKSSARACRLVCVPFRPCAEHCCSYTRLLPVIMNWSAAAQQQLCLSLHLFCPPREAGRDQKLPAVAGMLDLWKHVCIACICCFGDRPTLGWPAGVWQNSVE